MDTNSAVFCVFETITAYKESMALAWRSHIDGAVHIVLNRGRAEMCRTRIGSLLFTAVRQHLVNLPFFFH